MPVMPHPLPLRGPSVASSNLVVVRGPVNIAPRLMPMWIDWFAEISAIFVVQRRGTESIALLVAESPHASSVVGPRSNETIPHRHVRRLLTEIAIWHHSLLETEVGQICRLLGVSSWPGVLVIAVNQE